MADGFEFQVGRGQSRMIAEIQGLTVVLRIEAAQSRVGRGGTVGGWWGVGFHIGPELALQFDQAGDHLLVPLDAMDLQRLTAKQYRHIRGLFAGDGELVHHLQLNILGHAFLPEACPVYAGGLAFEDLHILGTDHLAVDVGEHPGQLRIRMLQHGVDATHLVLAAFAVMPGHDGLQDVAPVGGAFLILRIGFRQRGIATGFLQP
ncbi:hypothetical protein D9M69_490880 [compost metagenome]